MRILLVVEKFRPGPGGVEVAAWGAAHALAARGVEVHVAAREVAVSEAVTPHRLTVPTGWQPVRVAAFSRAAGRCAARLAPDVVQTFSRTLHQDVYRAGGGSHADYLERRHGAAARRLRRISPRHAVLLGIEERVFRRSQQWILCNSEMVRDELRRRYDLPEARLVVIPNGVDLQRFAPGDADADAAGRALRRELDDETGPVWLFLGSGFARKGVDTAVRALAGSAARESVLWVAGRDDGTRFRRLADQLGVAARVRFLGERADAPTLLAAADALLLPTRYDAFANACLEAAAAGRPVVTSGANGAAPHLGEGALVVDDPEDAAGFAKALDRLADPAERSRLGRAARAAAEGLGWSRHAERLLALYERVIDRKASRA